MMRALAVTNSGVSIVRTGKRFDAADSAFSADSNHGAARSDEHDALDLRLEWQSPRALRISYPPGARIFVRSPRTGGVDIAYAEAK